MMRVLFFFSIGLYSLLGTNQEKFTKLFHNACVKLRVELQTDSPRLLRVYIDVEKMKCQLVCFLDVPSEELKNIPKI